MSTLLTFQMVRRFAYHVNMVDVTDSRSAIEHLFFAYRAFTAGPDQLLESRGLGRVHHRILYFVGRHPGHSVGELLQTLGVSKQALNAPLRKLIETGMIAALPAEGDKRIRLLTLTQEGLALESRLSEIQAQLLRSAFMKAGAEATDGWFRVMNELSAHCRAQLPESGEIDD